MFQYSLKARVKKFGEKGEAAMTKELGQFHDRSVPRWFGLLAGKFLLDSALLGPT